MSKILKSVGNDNTSPYDLPTEKDKKVLIDFLEKLEPFGMFYLNSLKKDEGFQPSSKICSPHPSTCGYVREFGHNLNPVKCARYALDTIEEIVFQMLKIQILKEGYVYRNESFMVRIKRPNSKYPKYYFSEVLPLWNGHDEVEIVFFARNEDGVRAVKDWLSEALCRTLQSAVDETFDICCDFFSKRLMKDPEISFILSLAVFMTKDFTKDKLQKNIVLNKRKEN